MTRRDEVSHESKGTYLILKSLKLFLAGKSVDKIKLVHVSQIRRQDIQKKELLTGKS